jgi:NitT/TauT family transport system permease protein
VHRINHLLIKVSWPITSFAVAIGIWQIVIYVFHFPRVILPSPLDVLLAIEHNFRRLLAETGITMAESVLGFFSGSGGAFLLAVIFTHSRPIERSIYPYAIALKSTPLIAVAPLLILWFGNGMLSKVVMSAMVAFFPVLVGSVTGLTAVNEAMLDLMKSLSANWLQVLLKVRIPNSLPYLFASLKIASSMAVVGAVIGEFTGSISGIGHLLTTSSYYLDTPLVFAGVIFISVAGLLFFGLVAYIESKVVSW